MEYEGALHWDEWNYMALFLCLPLIEVAFGPQTVSVFVEVVVALANIE